MAPTFFETPEAFRAWLEENHETAIELSVGFRKKVTGRASITWPQAGEKISSRSCSTDRKSALRPLS